MSAHFNVLTENRKTLSCNLTKFQILWLKTAKLHDFVYLRFFKQLNIRFEKESYNHAEGVARMLFVVFHHPFLISIDWCCTYSDNSIVKKNELIICDQIMNFMQSII
jgi:hypothetical protein